MEGWKVGLKSRGIEVRKLGGMAKACKTEHRIGRAEEWRDGLKSRGIEVRKLGGMAKACKTEHRIGRAEERKNGGMALKAEE